MFKTLYLMRHAQTLFNQQGKTQGWCDSPLTPLGTEQARATGREAARRGWIFDHAYCSTSERTEDTLLAFLDAFGAPDLPYQRAKALKEMGFGAFEGKDAYLEPQGERRAEGFAEYGGETEGQVTRRMVDFLTDVMGREGHRNVLVVGHGASALKFFEAQAPRNSVRVTRWENCMTYVFDYEDGLFSCREIVYPEPDDGQD